MDTLIQISPPEGQEINLARRLSKECEELRHELKLGPEEVIPNGLAPSRNLLENEYKVLIKKKKERIAEQLQVFNEVKEACDRIGSDIGSIDNISTHIVPSSLIMEWKKKKDEADTIYNVRIEKIKELQTAIRKIVNHIGFGDNDLMLVGMDYDKYENVLSEEIVQHFTDLHTRVQQSFAQCFENIDENMGLEDIL
uniref:Uncharacterized protein n=1 Tax=Panagrolaimus davidi TaxID=227884 RepID=A0A914QDB1_9BILA